MSRIDEIRAEQWERSEELQKTLRGEQDESPTNSQKRIEVADAERDKKMEDLQQQIELTKAGITTANEAVADVDKKVGDMVESKAEAFDVEQLKTDVGTVSSMSYFYDLLARFDVFNRDSSGETFNHPFKVSLIQVEAPDDDYLTVSEGRLHFWEGDEWNIATEEKTEGDSWTVAVDSAQDYTAQYIYAQLKYEDPDWVWSLGHGEDNPQDRETNADDQEQRTWIIAKMDTDGSIDQRINQDIYETMGG